MALAAFVTGAVFGVRSVFQREAEEEKLKELVADTRDIGTEPPGPHMVLTDPSVLAGQDITIALVVTDIVDPNSFRGAAAAGGDDTVLVVYPGVPVVRLGERLHFTGGVRECTKPAADAYLKTDMSAGTFEITDDEYCVFTAAVELAEDGEV